MTVDRMSALDAGFFDVESDVTQMHIGSVLIVEGPPPPLARLRDMVAGKLSRVPRYRQVARSVPLEFGRPIWIDDGDFDLDYHLRPARVTHPGNMDQLRDLVGHLMGRRLDRRRPLWELWMIEGLEGDRWAVVAKVHHCMVDGVGGAELLGLILDPEQDADPLPVEVWEPEPSPTFGDVVLQTVGHATSSGVRVARAMRQVAGRPIASLPPVRDLTRAVSLLARTARPMAASSLNGPIGPNRCWAEASVAVSDVKKVRSSLGCAFNDVVLAAVTRGYRDLLAGRGEPVDHSIRTLVPVSVRGRDDTGRAIGDGSMANKVSAVFAELPIATTDPVERLDIISSQMNAAKETNQAQAVQWITNLANFIPQAVSGTGIRLFGKAAQRNVNAITTNIPGPQFPLYAAGRRVLRTYPYVPIGMQVRIGVAILSYDGDVNFGITGDYDHVPDVGVMAEGISAGMDELLVAAKRASSASSHSVSKNGSQTLQADPSLNGERGLARVPEITVRRLNPLPTSRIGRDFASGDLVMSHAIAVLSAMFPNGEDFFVRAVRNYRDEVGDPELRKQVTQFAGQESMHGRLHRELNRRLSDLGFKANLVDRGVDVLFNRAGSLLPQSMQLAVTAALEHYTATLAEVLLRDPVAQGVVDDNEVRHLLLWHALEESEHKAVAFDVYQTVSGNNLIRYAAMDVITGVFLGGLLLGTVFSTALDPSARDLRRLLDSVARLPRSPFLSKDVVRRIREYNRPDFHPDDFDASPLLERWRAELFGGEGLLTDRLKAPSTT
ncbi:MAG TPA: wax ester/triacylglycerol synthase family O-acyltransferase [Acidimicrobiales bacterium]|nr:wax ester/triacylglycerol synthase family O-acyltransferase [Acidimicrobiales bacterium]